MQVVTCPQPPLFLGILSLFLSSISLLSIPQEWTGQSGGTQSSSSIWLLVSGSDKSKWKQLWERCCESLHMGERNFSSSYSGKLVGLLEVNLTVLWDLLYLGAPGIFRVVQIELPAIHQLQFRFSRPALIPEVVSTTESLPVSLDSLHSPFSLRFAL